MAIITLTSDFGSSDGYVGIMKGVILGIAHDVRLVDLTHDIPPQDVREALYLLDRATPYFPGGAIHLAVVDPGVGSARRGLVVRTARASYVGPDNGIFTRPLAETGAQAWELDRPEFWLPQVSRTFHGRDVFAPVAAHLANGVPPAEMGRSITDPVLLTVAGPARTADGALCGQVVHVDRFGNLITDVPASWVAGEGWQCRIAGATIMRFSSAYAAASPGELLMLMGSSGTLEIAERNGNAACRLGVRAGEKILVFNPQ